MDVALVVDNSTNMAAAVTNLQAEISQVVNAAEFASAGDLHMGLVTFSPTNNIVVNVPLTANISNVLTAVQGLVPAGGNGGPEPSDEALQLVITGAADLSCAQTNTSGAFGAFRSGCTRIAVLITSAEPGECTGIFTPGVSDVHAHQVAVAAKANGVLIESAYVPTPSVDPTAQAVMEDYASTSGGIFVQTDANADDIGDELTGILASCGVVPSQSATRNARFWFTHAYYLDPSSSNCVSLLNGIRANGGVVNLGFLTLPTANRNADNVIDAYDTIIEALSFFWRSVNVTGENGGTQNAKAKGSNVCKTRKQLAAQLIAATANVRLLHANPTNSFYRNGATITNFPPDLLKQAQTALAGYDRSVMTPLTALLTKFNSSGVTNNLPNGLQECSPQKTSQLRTLSRDPTAQNTCPGNNNSCGGAAVVVFPDNSNPFASAIYSQTVNLGGYTNNMPVPTCYSGGSSLPRDAVWQILPSMGTSNRQFTVSTAGSNFGTMLAIWTGRCSAGGSNLVAVSCAANNVGLQGVQLIFKTDGTNTFFIVGEGPSGQYGKLKIKITSP